MFQTIAAEVRRSARAAGAGHDPLGALWADGDRAFILPFRGEYSRPAGLREPGEETTQDVNACVYFGNGATDGSDNALLFLTDINNVPRGLDDVWQSGAGPQGMWLPGLPIDPPPIEESTVYTSPPPGEEAQWVAIAEWARVSCGFDGGMPAQSPEFMVKTTAGEIRRRVVARDPQNWPPLGSNWSNEEVMYVVSFKGVYPERPGPPAIDEETGVAITPVAESVPPEGKCTYLGDGLTDPTGKATVGHASKDWPVDELEDLWRPD